MVALADTRHPWVTVRSPELSAEVDPLGAQLSVLRDRAGRNLLWHGDPAFWAGRAPILFPIVGTLAEGRYRLGERSYALGRHGFARGKVFETVSTTSSSALLRLREDASTLAVYPFRFELDVSFTVEGATLSVVASVRNTGEEELPASRGFHPGFLWPLPSSAARHSHFLEFEADEPAPVRRLDAAGLVSSQLHPTPIANRRLTLHDDLFREDVLILDQVRSRSVIYDSPDGGPRIEIRFPDACHLGVWTKPGAPFLCIEPWHGLSDPAGFAGDFREKPGVFRVAPGGSKTLGMSITVRA
jgi:galactose mutarotase-like enzyme